MRLEHEFTVPVPVPQAWRLLLDVHRIAPCLPGATVERVDGDEVVGRVKVRIGAVTSSYQGTARFVEKDEAAHRIVLEASGRETRGAGTASAIVTGQLHEEESSTRVTVTTDLDITGKPAQFGRGVLAELVDNLISQFASCLAAELTGPKATAQAEATRESTQQSAARSAQQSNQQSAPQPVGASSGAAESDAIDPLGTDDGPVPKRLAWALVVVGLMAVVWMLSRRFPPQIVVHVHVPSRPGVSS